MKEIQKSGVEIANLQATNCEANTDCTAILVLCEPSLLYDKRELIQRNFRTIWMNTFIVPF